MAAPQQNIADIVVLKSAGVADDQGDLNLENGAPVGLKLAAIRKAKGLSHVDIHNATKIKILHVAAIEAGERAHLPATPFAAGFVKAYAQFLGLDADAYAKAFKEEAGFIPLAAPIQDAIVREVMQSRRTQSAPVEAQDTTSVAPALKSTALVPTFQVSEKSPPQSLHVNSAAARSFDAEKLVTWLGAGAVVAIAAFIAGRAAQPGVTTSEIAPAPTVIAEASAPAAVKIEPPAPIVEIAPRVIEPVEASAPVAAVKPPAVKPKPKKQVVVETPAPISETPPSILFTMLTSEPAPVADEIAAVELEPPAETVMAEPEPTVIPANVTRGAAPIYPERCALRAGEQVSVSVIFSITALGKPVSASVAATENRCFNSAALRAVYDMRFSPRTIDGAPAIETGKTLTVQFVR